MSLSSEERDKLIQYRIGQAKETVEEADLLINNEKFRAAVNRIYYGMFYSLLALALKYEFQTSKHQQLIGWFNKNFIHPGLLSKKYGIMLRKAYQYRIEGDYEPISEFNNTEVNQLFEDMKEFISVLERYLNI
jgi:uncharacterized protein (UPF0332 family)